MCVRDKIYDIFFLLLTDAVYCHIVVVIHSGPTQVSIATLAGVSLGTFILGFFAAVAICFAIIRNRGDRQVKDDKLISYPKPGTISANMTSSEAYGLAEMPAQLHTYEYVTPKP